MPILAAQQAAFLAQAKAFAIQKHEFAVHQESQKYLDEYTYQQCTQLIDKRSEINTQLEILEERQREIEEKEKQLKALNDAWVERHVRLIDF